MIHPPHNNMYLQLLLGAGAITFSTCLAILKILSLLTHSVGIAPPTQQQLKEENLDNSPLFRHVPSLKTKLAWRELGDFPTPLHTSRVHVKDTGTMHFYVKREDLASKRYGGNKVRTLQHLLATIEARHSSGDPTAASVIVTGTGGSNQILATVVHAQKLHIPAITPVWMKDVPELDNTLNMLSTFTMKNVNRKEAKTWKDSGLLSTLLLPLLTGNGIVLPPGGNTPAGVIGQMGAALELSEQIIKGDMPDPHKIYLPVGSSCTISGLILGITLSRQLGMDAFHKIQICGVPIHHAAAFAQRHMNFYTSAWATSIPLTIRHTIQVTCKELMHLGGPDLLADALKMMEDSNQVRLITDTDIVGTYGAHSTLSILASKEYDRNGILIDIHTGQERDDQLWLCGHFTGKAFAAMRRDYIVYQKEHQNKPSSGEAEAPVYLFWQTKSNVQPRGNMDDEWSEFLNLPPAVQKWGDQGKSHSHLRQGVVNTKDTKHGPNGYRHLMTKIQWNSKM